MHLRSLLLGSLFAGAAFSAHANTTFDIEADLLSNSGGAGITAGRAIFLIVDTSNNGFAVPTPGTYNVNSLWGASSDDRVALITPFVDNFDEDGVYQNSFSLDYTTVTGWGQGDHLGLFWFPTVNTSGGATVIGGGVQFGDFTFNSSGDDAPLWATPPDNTLLYTLTFASSNAAFFPAGNDVAFFGTVIPEPSTYALFGGALALGAVLYRRRRVAA